MIKSAADFGNMRPRYSQKEFRLLDDYAYSLGIELIPCIQTLGHLTEAIKRLPYAEISDRPDILMAGDERVYALIDKMIKTMSECFRSKRIHIGLDEAFDLGLGNYLKKNGYHTREEIMTKHLVRVNEIVKKYNMKPMMWNDMFFRGRSKENEYYDNDIHFTKEDSNLVPNGMSIIYWDYYHFDKETYRRFLKESQTICDNATRHAVNSCKIKWYNRFTDGKNAHIFEFFAVSMFVIRILSKQQSTVTKKFAILLNLS